MSLSVTYDGQSLNDFLGVGQNYNAFDSAEWSNELRNIGNSNGTTYLYRSYGAKTITMPFYIKGSVKSKYDMLMTVLNVSEPKRLTFGNLANRYFLALPDGKVEFEMLGENAGRGTITWLIPDGISHSVDTKIVTASVVDGILTANVNNNGSGYVWPTYRLKSTADNGWYGIVHAGGILELGNRAETEGVDYKQDETLLDTVNFNESSWSDWSGTYPPDPNNFDLSGTTTVSGNGTQRGLRLGTYGNNTKTWNGAGKVYTLQADSEGNIGADKFYCYWNSFFWPTRMGQTGFQDIIFWSGNDIVARWYIAKTDKNGNKAFCRAFYNDGNGNDKLRQVFSFGFTSSHRPEENPFCERRGDSDFKKIGSKLQFYFDRKYYAVSADNLTDKKITRVSSVFTNFDKRTGQQFVANNVIRKIQIRKMYVDKWADIPNKYGNGSDLVVDTESATINLNGLPANDEAVNPPLFAPLQPGNNKIEFYQSDWSKSVPEVTVEWKERYL